MPDTWRVVRYESPARRRPDGALRRDLYSRIDPRPEGESRRGFPTSDADVSRTGHRRTDPGAHRLHQVTFSERGGAGKERPVSTMPVAIYTREHYLNASYGWKSWLLTRDHKRIGLLYLMSITFFFFLGGAFATMVRLELMTPKGDLFEAETYNKLFSMHGIVMVFLFLIPSIPAVLGKQLVVGLRL